MGVVFIHEREIWLPKSAFYAICDDVLAFLRDKIDDGVYEYMVGTAHGLEQLDLDDLDDVLAEQLMHLLDQLARKYHELKPYTDIIINS